VYYARDLGYFAKAGYDVTDYADFKRARSRRPCSRRARRWVLEPRLAHHRARSRAAGHHHRGRRSRRKGANQRIMTVAAASSIHSAKDLAGKTIAVSGLANITNLSARSWIDRNGGDSKASKYIEIPLPQMAPDVLSGRVTRPRWTPPATKRRKTLSSAHSAARSMRSRRVFSPRSGSRVRLVTKHPAMPRRLRRSSGKHRCGRTLTRVTQSLSMPKQQVHRGGSRERPATDFRHYRNAGAGPARDRSIRQIRHDQSRVPAKDFITTFAS